MVDAPLPAPMDTGAAAMVDCEAETGPAVTVTFAVCVIAIPSAVAEAVFDPATVELRVPVATPLASVGPTGWVNVLPVPVAASTTVAPLMGVPLAFFTVTVIVAIPLCAVTDVGEAATLDWDADTAGGVTATVTVWVTDVPSIVAETVFVSATVELRVPLATPLASLAVKVIVAVPVPTGMELGEAASADCAAETGPAVTSNATVSVIVVPFAAAETTLDPATVELTVPVTTPAASVDPAGCVSVFPLPVADSTTVAPLIGYPPASRTVTVIVEVPLPATSDVAEALTVDCEAETGPAATVTVAA